MRILVTGANGFLGRALKPLLPSEWSAIGLARAGGGDSFEITYRDLGALLAAAPRLDGVIHLAAQIRDPADGCSAYLRSNVDLPSTLVRAFPQARHVMASSVSVFGPPDATPITIASQCRPEHPYGTSKLAGEWVVRTAPNHAAIRFSSLLGPGMHSDTFVPRILSEARNSRRITLHGSGERLQNYLDVRDAARMCLRAMGMKSNFVTLGIGKRSWSNRAIADLLTEHVPAEVVLAGSDDSPSYVYATTGCVDLGENMHPLIETIDWLVTQ